MDTTEPMATESLAALIDHIKITHHQYVRAQIARFTPIFDKICAKHGAEHPELDQMRTVFAGLSAELTSHLMKEEVMLFPYIERLEEAVIEKSPVIPPPFGTVKNPVRMMMYEHDGAAEALRELRRLSNGYEPFADACGGLKTLYTSLTEFEADLHQHIHLENDILFPRAIALESA